MRIEVRGSGPVGLAFVLFARRAGVAAGSIRLRDPVPALSSLPAALAQRALALSQGSLQLLARVASPPTGAMISSVQVEMSGHAGHTLIRAAQLNQPCLGQVTPYAPLLDSLHKAWLTLLEETSDGVPPEAGDTLIVHAEGASDLQTDTREFGQHAVLATLHCPAMPAGLAIEHFSPAGPIALLPLPEFGHYSLVWCTTEAEALRLRELDGDDFVRSLQGFLGNRLLGAGLASARFVTPLIRRRQRDNPSNNEVWIGNAAQSLHPVAGQGLNLGLRDAFELAQDVAAALRMPAGAGPTSEQLVRRYVNRRAPDRRGTVALTDTLASTFTRASLAPWQSIALFCVDRVAPARNALANRLMFGTRHDGFEVKFL